MQFACPQANVKSSTTMRRRLCPLVFNNVMSAVNDVLEKELPKTDGFAITADHWTSRANESYQSMTLHFINDKYELRKFSMECRKFEGTKTAENIAKVLDSQVKNVAGKKAFHTVTAVSDSAANMTKSISTSRNINQGVRCVAHIIHNAVETAFNNTPILEPIIKKCKGLAAVVHRSSKTCDLIKATCEDVGISYKAIIQPVKTRWHSLVMCMQSILDLRLALLTIREKEDVDSQHIQTLMRATPTKGQYEVLQDLLKPLKYIKDTSEMLTSEKKPTIHMVVLAFLSFDIMRSDNPTVAIFLEQFKSYLSAKAPRGGREDPVWRMAAFFHPKCKGSHLLYTSTETTAKRGRPRKAAGAAAAAEEAESSQQGLSSQSQSQQSGSSRGPLRSEFLDMAKDEVLIALKKAKAGHAENPEADSAASGSEAGSQNPSISQAAVIHSSGSDERSWQGLADLVEESELAFFGAPKQQSDPMDPRNQIEKYVCVLAKAEDFECDVLAYWKSNEKEVPDLAKLARAVLGIPASSASSERMFSAAGNTITTQRTNLSSTKAEQLVLIKQNFDKVEEQVARWDVGAKVSKGKGKGKGKGKEKEKSEEFRKSAPQEDTEEVELRLLEEDEALEEQLDSEIEFDVPEDFDFVDDDNF